MLLSPLKMEKIQGATTKFQDSAPENEMSYAI